LDASRVHIFWDHSNLFIRAQSTADDGNGGGLEPGHRLDVRLSFANVFEFARHDRVVERAVAVGSVPPGLQSVWQSLGNAGMLVDLQERGAQSGKEQGVDQALQLEMMKSLVDTKKPAVAVLLTGDGGFYEYVVRLLNAGWGVEILSFSNGFSRKLKGVRTGFGGRGRYIELDTWYRQLVYLQDPMGNIIRPGDPLNLSSRPAV
jgi:uncharacterized LabA/DUF88 family protein